MIKKVLLTCIAGLATSGCLLAQDVDRIETKFDYIQLPSKPLDKSIKNYHSIIISDIDDRNKKLTQAYEAELRQADADFAKDEADFPAKLKKAEEEYNKEMANYQIKVKEANDAYQKEMAIYEQKSTLKKLADKNLANEGKPVNHQPNQPYLNRPDKPYKRTPSLPALLKTYNWEQLASTYLKLEGFNNGTTNAVNITATIGDLEMKEPELKVVDKTEFSNGKSYPYKAHTYAIVYKRLITLKVETPQGIIYNEVPNEVSKEKTMYSPEFKSDYELRNWWSNNKKRTEETLEAQTMDNNLKAIQLLLNNQYAFKKIVGYETEVYLVKDKKVDYSDYQTAYLAAIEGYTLLADNYEKIEAKKKINEAIVLWEKALSESDMENKKARIDEDVTYATYQNLVEAYIWVDEFTKAKSMITKLSTMDPPRKIKKKMEQLAEFQKAQFEKYKGFYTN